MKLRSITAGALVFVLLLCAAMPAFAASKKLSDLPEPGERPDKPSIGIVKPGGKTHVGSGEPIGVIGGNHGKTRPIEIPVPSPVRPPVVAK